MTLPTPCYLIDESRLRANLETIAWLREHSGARALLALKCFASWSVFPLMRAYLDGTTSSSLNEVRLGHDEFGGETHGYSVAWSAQDIGEAARLADKLIFNSISQLERLGDQCNDTPLGLRLNPGISNSPYLLADPARPNSRLGESDLARIELVQHRISGVMIHNNCENRDFAQFSDMLDRIEQHFGSLLRRLTWVSLGGGIHFTAPDYPLQKLADRLRAFADRMQVQVYLEPGEAAVAGAATLEVSVLDVLADRATPIAVIDASTEAHMLDLLTYQLPARILPDEGPWRYQVTGNTCLAGDIFGEFSFPHPLQPGDRLSIQDAAGYTMVKKNWFNGVSMPAIAVRRLDGRIELRRRFGYEDYRNSLS
ncbi:MAG: carboxynorspermidine decarboxylase [Lautropia sp.]|nr:carboxynorspermidine decarboxylase [Lautropia sp.]